MDKLQPKHVCAYAPYNIQLIIISEKQEQYPVNLIGYELITGTGNKVTLKVYDSGIKLPFYVNLEDVKLVLRPLEDIGLDMFSEQFFEDNSELLGDEHTPLAQTIFFLQNSNPLELFFRHHFDVFGLIDAGLAIDINTNKMPVSSGRRFRRSF
jgi:hypothetical protein